MHDSYLPEDMVSYLSFRDLIQGVWLWAYGLGYSVLGFSFKDYWFRRHVSHALQAIHPNTSHYLNLV